MLIESSTSCKVGDSFDKCLLAEWVKPPKARPGEERWYSDGKGDLASDNPGVREFKRSSAGILALVPALALAYLDDGSHHDPCFDSGPYCGYQGCARQPAGLDGRSSGVVFQFGHAFSDPTAMSALCHCLATCFMEL